MSGFYTSVTPRFNELAARDVEVWLQRGRALRRTVYGADALPLTQSKLHVPSLALTDLAAGAAGLAVHASGGIIAAAAGVTGTGKIALPSPIDPTKPFRVHMLVEINENANNLTLQLGSTGTPPFWSGLRMTSIKTDNISGNAGNPTTFNSLGGATGALPYPAGTKVWFNVCGDGQYISMSIIPDIAAASFQADWIKQPTFQAAYNRIYWVVDDVPDVSSGAGQFTWGRAGQADQLTQIYFTSNSALTRLIGVYCNVGELEGPGDARMGAPLVMALSNSQDNGGAVTSTPLVLLPPAWGCPGSRDFVMQHHPNGNPGTLMQSNSGPAALAMYAAGYGQGTLSGCQASGDYAGATSSNWGAPTGLLYRKNFLDYFRNAFRFDGKLIHFGMSMGVLNALRYFAEYGEGDAVVGISGAVDLTDSFNNRGFSAIINAGFGAWYRSVADANTGNAPEASPEQWVRINRGVRAPGLRSLVAPYNWRNLYAAGTTYAKHDVVYRAYAGGVAGLAGYDPVLTPKLYAGLPIKLWHGDADATIPLAQAQSFVSAVNRYASAASLVTVAGGGHVTAGMFDSAAIVAYLDSLA